MKKVCKKIFVLFLSTSMFGCTVIKNDASTSNTSGAMKAGVYTASSKGMNDDIEVLVEVSESKILKVEVTKENETPGIGGALKDSKGNIIEEGGKTPVQRIPEEIVEHQSLAVDKVTGATITTAAIKSAVKEALTQAGANLDNFNEKITTSKIEDLSSDVVVVGGGGAGLASAVSAAQKGAKVIVIEKNGSVGGDTLVCGAIYNSPDKTLQSKIEMKDSVKTTVEKALSEKPINDEHAKLLAVVQKQWDEYKSSNRKDLFDSLEWYTLQTWINGDKVADLDLVKVLCEQSYDGLSWIKNLGMGFKDEISQGAGSLWQRTHTSTMKMGTGFISTYLEYIKNNPDKITIITEATVKSLTKDDTGRVVGVVASDRNGNEFKVTGSKGVVIASGGFAANSKMVQEYNTSGKWKDLSKIGTTNRFSSSQGDGISMALAAGSSLTDMDQIQLLYLGNTKDGQLTKMPPRTVNGIDQIIFINNKGERFVREDGRRDEICLGVLSQPDSMFYMLESGNGEGYKDIKDPEWRSADGFTFEYLKENGYIVYGETLEELAKNLNIEVDALKTTLDTFNKSVESGDDKFGRTLFSTKLEDGPWVATPRVACIHHTMGGITIDNKTRVLDVNGNVIKGLYAAGEVTGGVHGGNRLGGNAVVDTVVFGKLAGETIVEDTK